MKKKVLPLALVAAFFFFSCKKITVSEPTTTLPINTADIKAPVGFTWENSKNINFTVNVKDARFPGMVNTIAIYDGDPAAGGILLAKGSATVTSAFKCKVYLSNHFKEVYVVKIAPDNSVIKQTQPISSVNISVMIVD